MHCLGGCAKLWLRNLWSPNTVFSIYSRAVTFTSDSGATDILMRQRDSHILLHYTTYPDTAARPGFDVANFLYTHGIRLQRQRSTLQSFRRLAPSLNEHGLIVSATYTNDDLQITTPTPYGPKTILYGVKQTGDKVWRFSLPKARLSAAHNVIRHEQHAELALYASATFGSPTFKTFHNTLSKGWLSKYPSLTAKILSRNQPHSPATALGHITASRSRIRSTKPKTSVNKNESAPLRPAHQLHHFQRTMSWPRRDRRPNAHQHPDPSPLLHPTAHSDTSNDTSPGPPAPVIAESLDSTRTMNSPLQFCKLASYLRQIYVTMLCSPTSLDASQLELWTDHITSFYRSTSATFTSSSWPATSNSLSSTPTPALSSGFPSSDTSSSSKS
jgi:hypothetical protein